jgi:hypothetical protein
MKEYYFKDKILKMLLPDDTGKSPSFDVDLISPEIGINVSQLIYLLDDLNDSGYISVRKTSGKGSYLGGRICNIEHKGIAFLNNGGFTKIAVKETRSRQWIIAKTVAAVFNSVLILLVAIWGVKVQIQANSLNKSTPHNVENAEKKVTTAKRDTITKEVKK